MTDLNTGVEPSPDCQHERGFNLENKAYYCKLCGQDWNSMKAKTTLWCAAYMVYLIVNQAQVTKSGAKPILGWRADMIYFHKATIEEARLYFYQVEQRVVSKVQIGMAIGMIAEDANGDNVHA